MIEAIYAANHEQNLSLSNRDVLLTCAEKAGVTGAEGMLNSDQESDEVKGKVQKHIDMGINSVPVLIFNDRYRIDGAPEAETLRQVFSKLLSQDGGAAAL